MTMSTTGFPNATSAVTGIMDERMDLSMPGAPLISFVVLAFNQERYIRDAVRSALAQTYQPLEILLIDDCSDDRTFDLINAEVAGHESERNVNIHRNTRNLGLAGSINRAWELSSGEFLIVQAGDDISDPERTEQLVAAWQSVVPKPDLVYSDITVIDQDGVVVEAVRRLPRNLRLTDMVDAGMGSISGCACAYSRRLHTIFGPLDERVLQEDAVYPFRALLGHGIHGVDRPLVRYRVHAENISAPEVGAQRSRFADPRAQRRWVARWLENQCAVAADWLHAWEVAGRNDPAIRKQLRRWIDMRQVELDIRRAPFPMALVSPIKGLLLGLPVRYMASLLRKTLLGQLQ